MRVAIMGGKLQGVEAVYLAKKAGWNVTLFDRRKDAQASMLADTFHCVDILDSQEKIIALLEGIDLMIPVIEDIKVLKALEEISRVTKIPLAIDTWVYSVTSSKRLSNQLFKDLDVPTPAPWPYCQFPVILKPIDSSGSEGVRLVFSKEELESICNKNLDKDFIIEEYLEGPSYSLEVVGFHEEYQVFQITELLMDNQYDCKRVIAPVALDSSIRQQFEEITVEIAKKLSLKGIMDVETILHNGKLKVLEIDARLPSQTPTAVYHSTGINMLEYLSYSYLNGRAYKPFGPQAIANVNDQYVIYEHFFITPQKIESCGEHIISEAGPLILHKEYYGADEALTDYIPGKKEWVLTMITKGANEQDTWLKRNNAISRIQKTFDIASIVDSYPESLDINSNSTKELNQYDSFKRERYRNNRRKIKRIRRRIGSKNGSYTFGYCCLCGWHAFYRLY